MRFRKVVSGLLACALVAASAFTGSAVTVKAENTEVEVISDPFAEIPDNFNPTVGATMTLKPGETASVKKNEVPEKVKDAIKVTYESQAKDIADVDENGNVTATAKLGYALIITRLTALSDGYMQEYYTLVKVNIDLSGVRATAKATSLAKGKTTTITPTIPASIKNSTTTYRAMGAVSVDKSGKVTAKSAGAGKVLVKVSASGKSITRTIKFKVGEITGASSVKVKGTITLGVNGLSGKPKWSLDSKSKKLASITSKGVLTAKKAGKVTVTAKVGTVAMTKTITIKKK